MEGQKKQVAVSKKSKSNKNQQQSQMEQQTQQTRAALQEIISSLDEEQKKQSKFITIDKVI
jgi:hypothetical protein